LQQKLYPLSLDIIYIMNSLKIALTSLLIVAFGYAEAATIAVNPGDSIQAAIYAAKPNDIIEVHGGIYYEHIKIDKRLTLRGIGRPKLDATASGSAITLKADGVTLEGFNVINSGLWPEDGSGEAGIKVLSSNNTIADNNASNNSNGIFILDGSNNTVRGNTANGNLGFGLRLFGSRKNIIFKNNFDRNYKGNVYDDGRNLWDNGTAGNHYGDFDSDPDGCRDADGNGICDMSRSIPGGPSIDRFPSSKYV
jgi:parallel beta-helix repeat protein